MLCMCGDISGVGYRSFELLIVSPALSCKYRLPPPHSNERALMSHDATLIDRVAGECIELWNQVISHEEIELDTQCLYEEQRARFNLWAVSLGVFESGHRSIDYRLRYNDITQKLVRELLRAIRNNLRYGEYSKIQDGCLAATQSCKIDKRGRFGALGPRHTNPAVELRRCGNR